MASTFRLLKVFLERKDSPSALDRTWKNYRRNRRSSADSSFAADSAVMRVRSHQFLQGSCAEVLLSWDGLVYRRNNQCCYRLERLVAAG